MKKALVLSASTLLLFSLLALTSLASAATIIRPTAPDLNRIESAPDRLAPMGAVAPGPMTSQLLVFNPDTTGAATVNVRVVKPDGAIAFNRNYTIASNGAMAIPLGSLGSSFQGSALVSSDKVVQAVVVDANSSQSARDQYEGTSGTNTTLTLPLVRHLAPDTRNSIIAVQNTGTSAASITLHYYDANGTEVKTQSNPSVPPLASTYFNSNSAFPSAVFTGTVKITANQNIAAAEQTRYLKDTASFRGLNSADSDTTLLVNLVARKKKPSGVLVRWGEIYVRNNGTAPTDVTVDYYSGAGALLTSMSAANVPAEGMAQFLTKDPAFAVAGMNGWAKITSSSQPVSAYSLDMQGKGNRMLGASAVTPSQAGIKFACGDVLRTANQTSTIRILNTSSSASAAAQIRLYNPSTGASLASKDVTFPPGAIRSVSLAAAEFGAAGTSYEGLAVVTSTGGAPAPLVVSVLTPYSSSGVVTSMTGYTCSKLQ